jgi:hypothetical protein
MIKENKQMNLKELRRPTLGETLSIIGWLTLFAGQLALYQQNNNPDPRVLIQTAGDGWSVLNDGTKSNIWIVYTKKLNTPTNGYVYATWDKEAKP